MESCLILWQWIDLDGQPSLQLDLISRIASAISIKLSNAVLWNNDGVLLALPKGRLW